MGATPEWDLIEVTLPQGYRFIGTVDRPGSDGNIFTPSDTYDLGQNAEGNFLLFRRITTPWSENSHHKGERLSDADIAGFQYLGMPITREQCGDNEVDGNEGNFSSLCRSHLILK